MLSGEFMIDGVVDRTVIGRVMDVKRLEKRRLKQVKQGDEDSFSG